MANAQQIKNVRQKLIETLGRHPSRLSQLVSEIKTSERGPMTREQATLLLAHERGIDLAKYIDSEDLATIRSMTIRKSIEPAQKAKQVKASTKSRKKAKKNNKKVFVVHGRKTSAKQKVAAYLKSVGLDPIILHEQPNKGRTIIEKLEDCSDVACAVVILTPDDRGGIKRIGTELQSRARQNVIYELGYFVGKLTRACVPTLYVEGVELPSDLDGVLYIPFDKEWQESLHKELMAMGLDLKKKT
ncbi:MAG: nucleotide-binding protein [Candidatus Paceibacterota bacterium]